MSAQVTTTTPETTRCWAIALGSRLNHDFPEGQRGLDIKSYVVPCRDLEDARQIAAQFIARNDLGGGNWSGGHVYADGGTGRLIARVHYNGRIETFDVDPVRT